MDFSYTEEQQQVINLSSQIFADMVTNERLKALESEGIYFDDKLWQELANAGLLGLAIDEAYGGMGLGFETLCLLIEEAGKTVAPVPLVANLVTAAMSVQQFASEELKSALLPKVASGEVILSSALHDIQAIDPSLKDLNLKGLELNGSVAMVTFAEHAQKLLVKSNSYQGPVVLLVDLDSEQIVLEQQFSTTGEPVYTLHFDQLTIGSEAIVAEGSDAQCLLEWSADITLAANCAMALGVSSKMLTMTAAYTAEREQFSVPIATFQAVAHRAADCFIDVENLRLVTQQAVSRLHHRQPAHQEVMIAKIWCGDVCHRVSQSSQHLHGGIGVDKDYPLFRYCLWAKQLEMSLGSSSVYLERLGNSIAESFKETPVLPLKQAHNG